MVNPKKSVLLLPFALVLIGGATAHEAPDSHPAAVSQSSAVRASSVVKPIAARYELRSRKLKTEWYLWRDDNNVETADLATGQSNIWERQGPADFSYRRVFHRDQRVVEYTPGEIRTRHAEPDWSKLGSIVSPHLLATLKRGGSKLQFGQKTVRYSGTIDGQKIDLWWLEQAQLPAQLRISGEAQRLEMTLKEIQAHAPTAWPRATDDKIASYATIDAADFGDMESDPFVARVMHQDGHLHSH